LPLEHFVPEDILSLGCFVVSLKVLSLGRLGHFVSGMFGTCDFKSQDVLFRDVLSLGTFSQDVCLGRSCLNTENRPGDLIYTFR
jgi:hypothetical protein